MKTRVFLQYGILLIAAVGMVGASAYRYFDKEDYEVFANVACDSTQHSCFEGDGEDSPESYEEIQTPAYAIPRCHEWAGDCKPLSCADGSTNCTVTYCDPSSDECVTP